MYIPYAMAESLWITDHVLVEQLVPDLVDLYSLRTSAQSYGYYLRRFVCFLNLLIYKDV